MHDQEADFIRQGIDSMEQLFPIFFILMVVRFSGEQTVVLKMAAMNSLITRPNWVWLSGYAMTFLLLFFTFHYKLTNQINQDSFR